jgi:hypothetical protein
MNKAALRDLEKLEAYHRRRMMECWDKGTPTLADQHMRMAETVRVCIVTVQAAENREPDDESAEKTD